MAKAVNHSARKHALLSASGASRWMNCTPSARLEENFEEKRSVYADEGTLAHEFGDIEIRHKLGLISKKVYNVEIAKLRKHELYSTEMEPEVAKYVEIVMEAYNVAKQKNPDAVMLVEQRLDFSHLVEQGFGTGDNVIIADGVLDVIDLKYGKGVKVDADENSQLKLYGSGALREYELLYDIHTVRLTIVQPRLDHVSIWEISVDDLIAWGENEVKPKALKAYAGEGEQTPGEWCKFCKAKAVCRGLANENMKLAAFEFQDPHILSDKEVIEIYGQLSIFQDWASSVSSYILDEANKGKQWPGYKLVEGRSNRKWLDENKVIEVLQEDYDENEYMNTKLAGIAAIEKLVGKANFGPKLNEFIVKPPGAPTLVPESDKRPAMGVEQAKLDFKD